MIDDPTQTRHWRRGESSRDQGVECDYTEEEFCTYARMLLEKRIKWRELEALYAQGKVKVPTATLRAWIYGKYKDQLEARLAGGGRTRKGPKHGMLTEGQEDFITGLVVEMARQNRALTPAELMTWGRKTAHLNGTRDADAHDVRKCLAQVV